MSVYFHMLQNIYKLFIGQLSEWVRRYSGRELAGLLIGPAIFRGDGLGISSDKNWLTVAMGRTSDRKCAHVEA